MRPPFFAKKSGVRKLMVPIADSPAVGPLRPAPLTTSTLSKMLATA